MFHEISSVSNPRIKELAKLRDAKHRKHSDFFLIDGIREIDRVLSGTIEIVELYVLETEVDFARELTGCRPNLRSYLVSDKVFDKIAFGNRREGVVALARTPELSLDLMAKSLESVESPLLAVLEGVEKPGNVGAIFRSADGAGVNGVIVADGRTDLFNPNTIRSSLGTVFRLPATESTATKTISWLRDRKIGIAVARCDGAISYTDYDFRRPTAIVLGSEADGLTDLWQGEDVTAISMPMLGIADSLNVSVAAAVLFYEARRQRSN